MNGILERIRQEELAKTKQCGCRGCTNQATHTWSGHPTCDDCATPLRKQSKHTGVRLRYVMYDSLER